MSSEKIEFKLVIEEDGKQIYSKILSYESVANITSNYDDSSENIYYFSLAAKHPASTVRENVAYKDTISEETVNQLSNDSSVSVLRNLVRTEGFREFATQDVIEKLVKLDFEIAQSVAHNVEQFQQAETTKLHAILMGLSDPSIFYALAGNCNTPKKILKELANHSDSYVSAAAKGSLSR